MCAGHASCDVLWDVFGIVMSVTWGCYIKGQQRLADTENCYFMVMY